MKITHCSVVAPPCVNLSLSPFSWKTNPGCFKPVGMWPSSLATNWSWCAWLMPTPGPHINGDTRVWCYRIRTRTHSWLTLPLQTTRVFMSASSATLKDRPLLWWASRWRVSWMLRPPSHVSLLHSFLGFSAPRLNDSSLSNPSNLSNWIDVRLCLKCTYVEQLLWPLSDDTCQ